MAGSKKNAPEHSGFDVPAFGVIYPKGTVFKRNAEGLIVDTILPKGKKAKEVHEDPKRKKK